MKLIFAAALTLVPLAAQAQTSQPQTPEAAIRQYIDGAFAAMDPNNDGRVERAEFDTFMRARLARQAQAFDAAFAAADKNSDGGIDKREAAGNASLLENFAAVDTDGNGSISKDELRSAMISAQAAEAGAQ